jgi:serine/threonine protein kinase
LIGGRYQIREPLGSGGMARVFLVHDRVTGRELALKRLSGHSNRKHLALFEREYYTLTGLHHPNIVEVYDYGADEEGPFYTMELLHGSDVSGLAPRPWPEVCRVLRDIASALALLHARRYLHRDISARNVWLPPDGRTRLIDFGALVPFGKSGDAAGTPPYVAPEVLHGRELDQRADLYALGALGYWLLTGMHAFPARSLLALEDTWKQRPRAAAHRVAELKRGDLPAVPAALDALIERLLSLDPSARPNNAAEVIDDLCAIAGLPGESQPLIAASYLRTPALIGRDKELDLLRGALERAASGRGTSVLVEAPQGMGRSRLLSELALHARIASALVLQEESSREQSTHGVAESLARKLLDLQPTAAASAAQPYASTLAHLSPRLRERLNIAEADLIELPRAHGEARMRVQAALSSWFLEVARKQTLVLLIDDMEACDPASAAWLASLVREAKNKRLLLIAALPTERSAEPHVDGLRRLATALTLAPLAPDDIAAMLQSVFGNAPHVARLADLVGQRAEGNPGRALDLIEHLVQQGLVTYSEGTWLLPSSIAVEQLPADPNEVLVARLRRLSPQARALGQQLSVRDGLIPFELGLALAHSAGFNAFDALEGLVREGVLTGSDEAYRFTREALRLALYDELDDARKRRAHRISGDLLLNAPNPSPLERLRGGLHLLLGDDVERGTLEVAAAGLHYGLGDIAGVDQAAPSLERALALFIALHRPAHELLALYAPLAMAGYYVERRFADRYAEPTLVLLQDLLGLNRARSLQRRLGRRPALLVGLGWAALRFRMHEKNPRVPSFRQAMMMLFNCVAALTGVCTTCIDPQRAERYANVLEPMRALGPDHVATLMHDFCLNLAATVSDRIGYSRARWQSMIERLDSNQPIRDMTSEVRILYLAGALYACGVMESWRDSSRALQFAQRLEDFKLKLYDLSAHQIRMMYYAHQGNLDLFEQYRERVEVHAIQRGTAWQAETWTFSALVAIHIRTHNALGVKYCVEQLKRLDAEVPSLKITTRRAQGVYLTLRGSAAEALTWLNEPEEPLAVAGWARTQGVRARAYNMLNQHATAREVCVAALAHLSPTDLEFPAMNLLVLVELALAEAGLGQHALAADRLDRLLATFGAQPGPLTMSALHEARVRVAVLMQDRPAIEHHLDRLDHWLRSTGERSLIARGERIAKEVQLGAPGSVPTPLPIAALNDENGDDGEHALTVVHRLRHGGERSAEASAEWILDQLAEYADIRAGHVFLWRHEALSCIASRGDMPAPEVFEPWLFKLFASDPDQTTEYLRLDDLRDDPDQLNFRERSYRLLRLITAQSAGAQLVGALLLADDTVFDVPLNVRLAIADRLQATIREPASFGPGS